jgi:hypothetical protein
MTRLLPPTASDPVNVTELRKPMGIAIVGGLLVSQWVTLYTTPIVYIYLDRLNGWMSGLFLGRRLKSGHAESVSQ